MTIKIAYEDWSPEEGNTISTLDVEFDPLKYKTKAGAAKALYKALCETSKKFGHDPAWEVHLMAPKKSSEMGYGNNWRVSWEAGPYQWAIGTSFQVCNHAAGWYTEPYYSFDLCFTE